MASTATVSDVHAAAAKVGVKVADDEVEAYYTMLAAAEAAFSRLLAMPDYHLPLHTEKYPRKDIHKPTAAENVLGVAWAHTFSAKSTSPCGLLAGKTFCLKDNICVAGVPQVNGTEMVSPWVPESDATVVSRILEAGGEIIGTATCENMSYSPSSNTSATGAVHNPYAKGYSAGGSSSGVGALVGSPDNWVDMGIGADQGGSIRIPAAMSGAVGLKPTHGLVPYTGIVSSEAVMDYVGPICKNVMDVAVLLEAIAGRDGLDDRTEGAQRCGEINYSSNLQTWFDESLKRNGGLGKVLKGTKVGILKEGMEEPNVHPEMRKTVYESAYKLRVLGADVEEISMPAHSTGRDIWMGIRRIGGSLALAGKANGRRQFTLTPFLEKLLPMTQDKWEKMPPAVKSTIINGGYVLEKYPTLYHKCLNLAVQRKCLAFLKHAQLKLTD
jgi:amidase